jgi:hypothetical protein
MGINLGIDGELIEGSLRLSGCATKREGVTLALQESVRRRKQLQVLQLENSIDFDPDYDYKKQRLRI